LTVTIDASGKRDGVLVISRASKNRERGSDQRWQRHRLHQQSPQ